MFAGTSTKEDGHSESAISAHDSLPFTEQLDLQFQFDALLFLHGLLY
jgi:hypothetical protein